MLWLPGKEQCETETIPYTANSIIKYFPANFPVVNTFASHTHTDAMRTKHVIVFQLYFCNSLFLY